MKRIFWLPSIVCSLLLAAACNDGKGNAEEQHTKGAPSTHDKNATKDKNTTGMKGMEMEQMNAKDTLLLSVVAAANKVVLSDQYSVRARILDTVISINGYGYVTWDIRRNKKIAARTGGRIEKLFVKYNYQYVNKGQKILNLYTPEINTYAAEYLHHYETPGDEVLRIKAKEKLKLLGITEQQIRQLETTGRIDNTLSVYSNANGYTLFDAGNTVMSSGMNTGKASGSNMGGGNNPAQTSYGGVAPSTQLREGMYINRDQTLFYVNDFTVAWGVLSFDEATQSFLRSGMNVVIKSELLNLPLRSTISFIEPSFNNTNQKFMQVRTYLPNPGRRLRINSLIEGTVEIPLNGKILIPAAAIFSLGKRKIVWVKTGTTSSGKNIFKARDVQVSLMDKNIAVITMGLTSAEEVAADAGYLLDSQSLIEQ